MSFTSDRDIGDALYDFAKSGTDLAKEVAKVPGNDLTTSSSRLLLQEQQKVAYFRRRCIGPGWGGVVTHAFPQHPAQSTKVTGP
jgi:hypothetical protein